MLDALIIGAGVVGSALARALILKKPSWKIAVLEKEDAPARHTSGRNSGVVHSGFNQKPGTLKAKLCVEGNRLMREYCEKNKVPFLPLGTVVTAVTDQEVPVLEELKKRGDTNGTPGLRLLNQKELKQIEPNAKGLAALLSPTGAIADSKALTQTVAREAQEKGVQFQFFSKVCGIDEDASGFKIAIQNDSAASSDSRMTLMNSRLLINCAGLYADQIAQILEVGVDYRIIPFRGEYYKLPKEKWGLINSMVYPVPNLKYPFLGVHWTKKIDGSVALGPNAVLAFGRESYSTFKINAPEFIDMLFSPQFLSLMTKPEFWRLAAHQLRLSTSKKAYIEEASILVDGAEPEDLMPGPAGNRAQLVNRKGELVDDIVVEQKRGSWHVLNAVSPGFTSSLAFADYLAERILEGSGLRPVNP